MNTSKYVCTTPQNGYYVNGAHTVTDCLPQGGCADPNNHSNRNAACIDVDTGFSDKFRCTVPTTNYAVWNSVVVPLQTCARMTFFSRYTCACTGSNAETEPGFCDGTTFLQGTTTNLHHTGYVVNSDTGNTVEYATGY